MTLHTPDFGLSYFGPGVPGSLTDEGGKFTLGDRILISRLLAALASHDHTGGDKLADPSGTPALALDNTTGALPGGLNVYYRVSYVDQYNLETSASAEAVVSTPALLAVPSFPILTTEAMPGGDMNPGLGGGDYVYALTAFAGPQETPLGIQATLTLDGTLPVVIVTFPDAGQDGQDQWGIWRKGPGEAYFTFLDAVDVTDTDYLDDGAVANDADASDPSHQPPTANLTSSSNSVTIAVPDPTIVGATPHSVVHRWRIYRTYTSGSYAADSLLAEIVQTVNEDGTGGLITEFIDDGSIPLQPGQPLDVSEALTPSVRLNGLGGGAGPVSVRSVDGTTSWAISVDLDGALVTEPSEVAPGDGDLILQTIGLQLYRITVNTDGSIQTTAVDSASVGDSVFSAGEGPMVATPDASFAYHLTIDSTGTLITTPVGVHHPIPGQVIVGNGVPSDTMPGRFDGLVYKDRIDSFQEYTWDVDRWHKQGVAVTAPSAPKLWCGGGVSDFPLSSGESDYQRSNTRGIMRVSVLPSVTDGGYPAFYSVDAIPLATIDVAQPTDLWAPRSSAQNPSPGLWRLTEAVIDQVGAAFTPTTINITNGASIAFSTNIYNFGGTGADGFSVAFLDPAVATPATVTMGGHGTALGVQNMPGTIFAGFEAFPSDNSLSIGSNNSTGGFTSIATATSSQTIRGLGTHWTVTLIPAGTGIYTLSVKTAGNVTVISHDVTLPDHVYIGFTAACGGFVDFHEVENITIVDGSSADLLTAIATPTTVRAYSPFEDQGDGGGLRLDLAGIGDIGYQLTGTAFNVVGSVDADSKLGGADSRFIPSLYPDAPTSPSVTRGVSTFDVDWTNPSGPNQFALMPDFYLLYYTTNLSGHDYVNGSATQDGWTELIASDQTARDVYYTTPNIHRAATFLTGGVTYRLALVASNHAWDRSTGTVIGFRESHTTWTQTL